MVAVAGAPSGDIRALLLGESFESLVHAGGYETRSPSSIHLDFALALHGAAVRWLKAFLVAANPPVTRPLPSGATFYRLATADIPARLPTATAPVPVDTPEGASAQA
jgi:hypothetical protein